MTFLYWQDFDCYINPHNSLSICSTCFSHLGSSVSTSPSLLLTVCILVVGLLVIFLMVAYTSLDFGSLMCLVYISTQFFHPFVFAALGFVFDFSGEESVFSFLAWIRLFWNFSFDLPSLSFKTFALIHGGFFFVFLFFFFFFVYFFFLFLVAGSWRRAEI